jgi:hypothetical protein
MRTFPVDLPSGQRYWTVIDDDLRVVPFADQWLPFLRVGRGRAEPTTKSHASGAALYFRWCLTTGRNWTEAAQDLGLFMVWLKYTPSQLVNGSTGVAFGPGTKPARGERRINVILTALRGLLSYAVSVRGGPRYSGRCTSWPTPVTCRWRPRARRAVCRRGPCLLPRVAWRSLCHRVESAWTPQHRSGMCVSRLPGAHFPVSRCLILIQSRVRRPGR